LEAGCLGGDLVVSDRQAGQVVDAAVVAGGGVVQAALHVGHRDLGASDHGALVIRHRAGDRSGGLLRPALAIQGRGHDAGPQNRSPQNDPLHCCLLQCCPSGTRGLRAALPSPCSVAGRWRAGPRCGGMPASGLAGTRAGNARPGLCREGDPWLQPRTPPMNLWQKLGSSVGHVRRELQRRNAKKIHLPPSRSVSGGSVIISITFSDQ
jgi:hypothetical protein